MIPILYPAFEHDFDTNGIGALTDCISCKVTSARNDQFDLTMKYPALGRHFDEIQEGRIVYVSHDDSNTPQPFEIKKRSSVIDGTVQIWAQHISQSRLSKIILKPFTASNIVEAFQKFKTQTFNDNDFSFLTDKSTVANFTVSVPASALSMLGGVEGSILDVYGGEYEFDHYTVKLYNSRGQDNGVLIRYSKNLVSLTHTINAEGAYNAVIPYWQDFEGNVVYGNPITAEGGTLEVYPWTEENDEVMTDENSTEFEFHAYVSEMIAVDFSEDFGENKPTKRQLEERAKNYLSNNRPWEIDENIKFNFVELRQTNEYENYAPLEHVQLCDTVTIEHPDLKLSAKAKVIKLVWDALEERYDSVEVGNPKEKFYEAISADMRKVVSDRPTVSWMDTAISNAVNVMTGGVGGNIIFRMDDNGKPSDFFVMDTNDQNTAQNVWRLGSDGVAFSNTGINGQYRVALNMEGGFDPDTFADMISPSFFKTGIFESANSLTQWDLDNDVFRSYDQTYQSSVEISNGQLVYKYDGEEKRGYSGTVTISGVSYTFTNGILTAVE